MTRDLLIADVVTEISQTAKQLGAKPTAGVREVTQAVAALERKRMVTFDHEKFTIALDAIRDHKGIQTEKELADAIGIHPSSLARLRSGKAVDFETLLAVVVWSQLDLRKFIRLEVAAA